MDFLKSVLSKYWKATQKVSLKIWQSIEDSNTYVRWILITGILYGIMRMVGFQPQEFKVTWLVIWYAILTVGLSNFVLFIYTKVNYHKLDDESTKQSQARIFEAVATLVGLIVLGTYIAQYH